MIREFKKGGLDEPRDINSVIISGRVMYEPTPADYTVTEKNGARFNLKIRTDGVSKTPQVFRIVVWGKRATEYYPICKKGDYILVQGSLRKNNWVDDKDIIHDEAEIDASKVSMLGV